MIAQGFRGSFNTHGQHKLGMPRPEIGGFEYENFSGSIQDQQRQWDVDVVKVTAYDLMRGLIKKILRTD